MNLLRTVRHSVSILATAGLLSLLLADSAEELCAQSSFDRTFDITTTCGGDLSGRIRINGSMQPGVSDETASLSVTKASGDVAPVAGGVVGACSDEDEPFVSTGVTLKLPISTAEETGAGGGGGAAGGGGAGGSTSSGSAGGAGAPGIVATCRVDLKTQLGKDVACTIDGGDTCTVRLTAAQ
ncbi:hypothetical protein [Polyangium jinanense]|uniref:Uncharacterized protein n=1 Tax=Polyangium jinanense TaxID=2829994 RepID=A0A9X3XF26_9BACT|nr:hypothetical protein [Polyangium jinanense]MDC3959202.1 hypothetical protein [Polyangium jinanense]MDC3987578.1 hypothetical protein [Polyangium jinanense]MDC3989132.1 hypothetical protein [Polyangium jinanense]